LGWYEAEGWEAGCERCIELINFGGRGHSLIIHATNEDVIMAFGLEKPVFRIGVNTMGTLGMIGMTTGVMPSLTLGPGGIGGAITGDNVTVYHLFNVKRMAFETSRPPEAAMRPGNVPAGAIYGPSPQELEKIVREVVGEIINAK
jgi:acetaldehyde dehydrogenase (acetylating)